MMKQSRVRSKGFEMKRVQIFAVACLVMAANTVSVNVGVIVDSSSWSGKIAKTAMKLAVDDVNESQILNGTELCLLFKEAKTPLESTSAAIGLLTNATNNEVVALIEAEASKTQPFLADLGEASNIPVLSLSITSPSHSHHKSPYFVRMSHTHTIQMKAIATLIKHYGWRSIAVLYSDNYFGLVAMPSLRDALQDLDTEIAYTSIISSTTHRLKIREELHKLKEIEPKVYVVHAPFSLAMNVFMEAQDMGMMDSGYVWITTQGFTSLWDYALNSSTISSMQGLLGIKTHIPNSEKLKDFTQRWERQFRLDNPNTKNIELNSYGLLAYDTVLMIAQAIGKMEMNASLSFLTPSTSLGTIGNATIKVFQEGRKLLREIILTDFDGLSGRVKFHDGEMHRHGYEIVNVVGKSYQIVGYWPFNSSKLFKTPSFDDEGLRAVIWPGGSFIVPRGWAIPTRLRIAVPRKSGWEEFVSVSFDPTSHAPIITGFSISIFQAVARIVDPQLVYDFIPYPESNIYSDNYSYEELIMQVYLKKYDAVVGDVTITANRSKIVDFTQPYTETGLVMVAPTTIKEEANNAWTFLQPFTPALWATTIVFLIYTGLVVWFLEHKINPDFRGSPLTQVVTLFWFAFSAMFYAHRESIHNSLSRLVLVPWLFVAFVLTSSYTANLASRLTAQQITPIVDVSGHYKLGYRSSYVGSFLTHDSGMANINLEPYSSRKAYKEALSKGAKNGGVDAILDEIPFVRAFLSIECGYSMVGSTYQSGGFGFVFRKGSPLVKEFSMGILNLSESDEFEKLKSTYFNDTIKKCPDPSQDLRRLGVRSFWGLYLITGTISSLSLICFFSQVYYSRKNIRMFKSIKYFTKYIYQEQVSPQIFSLEILSEKNSSSNTKESSGEHYKLDVSVLNDTKQNVMTQTSSFANHEIIDEISSRQIHGGEKATMSCSLDIDITK